MRLLPILGEFVNFCDRLGAHRTALADQRLWRSPRLRLRVDISVDSDEHVLAIDLDA